MTIATFSLAGQSLQGQKSKENQKRECTILKTGEKKNFVLSRAVSGALGR